MRWVPCFRFYLYSACTDTSKENAQMYYIRRIYKSTLQRRAFKDFHYICIAADFVYSAFSGNGSRCCIPYNFWSSL